MWLSCCLYSSAYGGMSRQTEIETEVEESRVFIDVRVCCDDVVVSQTSSQPRNKLTTRRGDHLVEHERTIR